MAVAGEDYCIVAADTRMSTGFSIMTRDCKKIIELCVTHSTVLRRAFPPRPCRWAVAFVGGTEGRFTQRLGRVWRMWFACAAPRLCYHAHSSGSDLCTLRANLFRVGAMLTCTPRAGPTAA